MGPTSEAVAETTEMGIATLVQTAAQRISVESHRPKCKPRKITKTNKIDSQWAEFLISKHTLKTFVWLLITVVEAVWNRAEVHHWRDLF